MQFSLSEIPSGDTRLRDPLHKQQSLPLRPIIPLVARISDQNASGAPPMTVREKTRLEKFRQLLSSHNTDLGEFPGAWASSCCGDWGPQRTEASTLPSFTFWQPLSGARAVIHRYLIRSLLSETRDCRHVTVSAISGGSHTSPHLKCQDCLILTMRSESCPGQVGGITAGLGQ